MRRAIAAVRRQPPSHYRLSFRVYGTTKRPTPPRRRCFVFQVPDFGDRFRAFAMYDALERRRKESLEKMLKLSIRRRF
jgi:hypothetical protein